MGERKLSAMQEVDESMISGKVWAEDLLKKSTAMTKKAVLHWCNIVCKIGEAELDLDQYATIFLNQIETLYEDLIADVDTIQEKSLDKIAQLLQQLQNLCRDLHIDMPTFNYEDISLCDLYKLIRRRVDEYESLAEIRRKELKDLHQKQIKLCKSLGRQPKLLEESPLPLPKEVDALRLYIEALENDAIEREEKFFQLKQDIVEIVEELKTPPTLDFERDILNLTYTEVKIGDSDMEQLQQYHDRLVKQVTSVKEEIAELRSKIDDLWDKLEIDIAERDAFRKKNTGNSIETLAALKNEVVKLEEMKKANIKGFIEKQRQELVQLWNKCHCTELERSEFNFFHSECYNEDLFELHEREIERWKSYYEENKEIFSLLDEYKKLYNDHLELERSSGGANRYKNRGGQLLLEEKMRNKFRKRIPKIEENLNKLSETYFILKGKHFRTFGLTIEEYINKLHEDEDKEFKLKLSAKKQQREQASTVGRSRMNLFPPTTNTLNPSLTPRSTTKRKIFATPITEPTKLMKKFKTCTNRKTPRTGLPTVNVSLNRRRSEKREKLRQRLSFKSSQNSNKEKMETSSTSYDDFEEHVSSKFNCRSTGFVLKETNLNVPCLPVKNETFLDPGITYLPKTPRR